MSKYKITRMNTGFGDFIYIVNRVSGNDLIPVRPTRSYTTRASAEKRIKSLLKK